MRFPFRLIFQNLFKHPVRTLLTLGSVFIALFLLCTLSSLLTALTAGVQNAKSDRIIVQSSVSLFVYLPESYMPKVKNLPGVQEICSWNWFGGYYQSEENFFAQFGTQPEEFFRCYPEIRMREGTKEAFIGDRSSCIIGRKLVDSYGFKVGDQIPIISAIFWRGDSQPWSFKVAGIYESTSPNVDEGTLFFHFDYLRESLVSGAATGPEGAGVLVVQTREGVEPVGVMREIDEMFANGPQRTQSGSESEFQAQFVSMLGNVPFFLGSIGFGVLFAILLAVVNTMLMAAREQGKDVGILKALGFQRSTIFTIFLGQSMLLAGIGGGLGILISKSLETPFAEAIATRFPGYAVTTETLVLGVVTTLAIGVIAGIAPAFRMSNTKVVDALRSEA